MVLFSRKDGMYFSFILQCYTLSNKMTSLLVIHFISQGLGRADIHQGLGVFFCGQITETIFNSVSHCARRSGDVSPCAKRSGDHYSTYLGVLVKLS